MKIKIWHIDGYRGFDNCDGPSDYNKHFEIAMDSRFSQEDVTNILLEKWKKFRSVSLKVTFLKEVEI